MFKGNCNKCGEYGHMSKNCPKNNPPNIAANVNDAEDQEEEDDSAFSIGELEGMLQRLKGGKVGVALGVADQRLKGGKVLRLVLQMHLM